jgi:hypothetical protein
MFMTGRNRFPELIPELKEVVTRAAPRSMEARWSLKPKLVFGEQAAAAFQLPVHSRVIAIHGQLLDDGGGVSVNADVGIFHSCEEFVTKAKQLSHPFDSSSALVDDLLVAIFELFTFGLEHMQLKRGLALSFFCFEDLAR